MNPKLQGRSNLKKVVQNDIESCTLLFMNYTNTTQVPNVLFDKLLSELTEKELKVLLVIIRQTLGWKAKNGTRKKRDWISQKLFCCKTGMSNKSISRAISALCTKNLILCTNKDKKTLIRAINRKGREQIFYQLAPELMNFLHSSKEKCSTSAGKNVHTTKLILTKLKNQLEEKSTQGKLTDTERLAQILLTD